MLTSAKGLPVNVYSVSTVDNIECGGDMHVVGTLHADHMNVDTQDISGNLTILAGEGPGEEGNLVVQDGDIVLHQNSGTNVPGRTKVRSIWCSSDDSGLVGGAVSKISMFGDDNVGGIPGNIAFYTQSSGTVPPSELLETMRVRGTGVGIHSTAPVADLQVNGSIIAGSASSLGVPGRTGTNKGAALCIRSNAPSMTDTTPFFIYEAGTTSDGSFPGFNVFNVGTYLSGGSQHIGPKLGWRQVWDQRAGLDVFSIDTKKASGENGIAREWLTANGLTGDMTLNNCLAITNDSIPPSQISPAVVRPLTDFSVNLGSASFRFNQLWADNINPSDRTIKKDIAPLDRGLDFITALEPVKYRFIENTSNRFHFGFIAQDVETVFAEQFGDTDGTGNGVVIRAKKEIVDPDWTPPTKIVVDPDWVRTDDDEVAPMIEVPDESAQGPIVETDEDTYALRYQELISPLVQAVKELKAIVDAKSAIITTLQQANNEKTGLIASLTERVQALE